MDAPVVADAARKRFAVGNGPGGRLEEAYQAAAKPRLDAADGRLNEHGSRPDDDQQEDSRPETVAKFGIIPKEADEMVDAYDTRQRDAAVASVEQLLADGIPRVQVLQQTIMDWGGTRYIAAALETLAALEPPPPTQEQKTPQRRRGGSSLGLLGPSTTTRSPAVVFQEWLDQAAEQAEGRTHRTRDDHGPTLD